MIGCSGGGGGGSSRHWFRQRGGLGRLGDCLGSNRGLLLLGEGRRDGGDKEGFYYKIRKNKIRKNNTIRITHTFIYN